ncbi:MAG: hypothetical protein AB7N76_12830 [Planctomycetota bacterium]
MSLYDRSKAEIEDLHRCQFDWCKGRVTNEVAAWERIQRSWATGFRLADDEGLIEGSKRLLGLQVRFNERVDDPLQAVWIEGFTGYQVAEDLFQAYYEEWSHQASGQERGRAWSVLLRSAGEGPFGLEWVHAHRCWLAPEARPTFRPLEALDPLPTEAEATDDEPTDVPWAHATPPVWAQAEPAEAEEASPPPAAQADLPPSTEIRAFFGDAEAQAALGGAPPPVFDQHDPDCWLRVLRKGSAEAVLRAGLVVLEHLLGPWGQFFPEESAPRAIHEGLTRFLQGDAQGLADAKALIEEAADRASLAKDFEPDEAEGPLPADFKAYVRATNAAEAAARLAAGADGSALALAVKLSPILMALSQQTLLALRPEILRAFPPGD